MAARVEGTGGTTAGPGGFESPGTYGPDEVSPNLGNCEFQETVADLDVPIHDRRVAIRDRRTEDQAITSAHLQAELQACQEREKARIAADLHDSIGSSLSAIKVGLEYAIKRAGAATPRSDAVAFKKLLSQLQATIREVHRIAIGLRPPILDDLGIVATVEWFCRELEGSYHNVGVLKRIGVRESEIPDFLKTTIFRILQEGVNNTLKHSGADLIYITLSKEADEIQLSIMDNGEGFDISKVQSSFQFGIASMRQRAKYSGGTLVITTAPGAGTQVFAAWPSTTTAQARR
ncbi:MAG TPA: sensor histidine kinase [Gemmatimonadales bacterium]|nr:sensor histidine kinase [Gemmatimonadales bacterium]